MLVKVGLPSSHALSVIPRIPLNVAGTRTLEVSFFRRTWHISPGLSDEATTTGATVKRLGSVHGTAQPATDRDWM